MASWKPITKVSRILPVPPGLTMYQLVGLRPRPDGPLVALRAAELPADLPVHDAEARTVPRAGGKEALVHEPAVDEERHRVDVPIR
jgi:hypothetical protein